jgi:hypothetical protein
VIEFFDDKMTMFRHISLTLTAALRRRWGFRNLNYAPEMTAKHHGAPVTTPILAILAVGSLAVVAESLANEKKRQGVLNVLEEMEKYDN